MRHEPVVLAGLQLCQQLFDGPLHSDGSNHLAAVDAVPQFG
jgi:hypothetical protein